MARPSTLRRQLLVWLLAPLLVLWSISLIVDSDIATRSVVQAYDRALLESEKIRSAGQVLAASPGFRWTDDFNNLLRVLK